MVSSAVDQEDGAGLDTEQHLLWMCEKCGKTTEGKSNLYLNFCQKHPSKDGCNVILVDDSHQMVAKSKQDAIKKGIFDPPKKKDKEAASKEKDKSTGGIPKDGQPLALGFYRTEKVELDSRLFLYRDIFVQEELVPADITMGAFLLGTVETLLEMTGRRIGIIQTKGGHQ